MNTLTDTSQIEITPSRLRGSVSIAASKSMMQRVCAAALLKKGKTIIHNSGNSNDDVVALRIIQQLGAEVIMHPDYIEIISSGISPVSHEIDCGESGLSIRMFTPIVALSADAFVIDGQGSLTQRPLDFFERVLPVLGVQVQSQNGKVPLHIKGPLTPANVEIDGSGSSQYLTGLLMSYAAAIHAGNNIDATIPYKIEVNSLKSKPYIDLTFQVMQLFGLPVPLNQEYQSFIFEPKALPPSGQLVECTIEGDWSGGAFFLVAAAIHGNITVKGLSTQSVQADKVITNVLKLAGAGFSAADNGYVFRESHQLKAFVFDATDCPDLFPPLVTLATFCSGKSIIKGVSRLLHKESNRAVTLAENFGKMGVEVAVIGDEMRITGGCRIKAATVSSHNDHRIAMACAIVASKADGITTITQSSAINKSYPAFYKDLALLGAIIK